MFDHGSFSRSMTSVPRQPVSRSDANNELLKGKTDRGLQRELAPWWVSVESKIVLWEVQSINNEDVDFWQARLDSDLVDEAVSFLSKTSVNALKQFSLSESVEFTYHGLSTLSAVSTPIVQL